MALLKKQRMLRRQLDLKLLLALDRDGEGVDKAEFVLGMLESLQVISKEDYLPFLRQFDEMDHSGDGRLTHDDLAMLAEKNLRKVRARAGARARARARLRMRGRLWRWRRRRLTRVGHVG